MFVTCRWCCYVRGLNDEDISYFVEKVSFTLHHSFEEPIVRKSPFKFRRGEVAF